ncbi:MAG: serine/threonine protein kinase [Pseudanabaena sp.]|nr:serine/threonine protein kinase [Pseudanabaena sp. M109S1SP2A07QC]MCA6525011.1 serine/threonine protein kinase [Pseudanabaena sp. M179S2SP2A07QC]MCA6530273.1 serine/threonine protein kinase [Pseudanabaena sp. M125S2SP2A07QC]MCA6536647.1 serine/threonine protein kinase [Pseudanabaena sp. M176S2SP2A07QC]MCA6540850.1 serine/threonine protein kinase [Pseudanabaena sp. M037S2SP2A07QC]MCA6543673.1 serine/threonine protein kinase [Pseudanabaena sp. M074S1SP2A07QC]MCA6549255.1 serine/threonine pro
MTELHQIGEIIQSRYRIVSVLGQGGVGITYAALDAKTGDRVALKALSFRRMNEWKMLELFEREARVLSQLDHPAIPRYLDYFQIDRDRDRDFYIVQQLVEGKSLAQAIADGWHGSEEDIKQIAEQVLDVLIYLHELKPPVIHRDIKPQNVILQPNRKIALVDFGAVQDTYRSTQVGGSTVVGTYGYMPPEQFRGKAVPATDLYALGATILFLLTGRSPVELPEIKLKLSFRDSVNISSHFADWLDKMIEPAIEDRFSSAKQSLNALQNPILPSLESRIRSLEISHSLGLNSDHNDTKYQYPKPLGSRIEIKKSNNILKVDIPAAGLRGEGISLLLFAIFWNVFLIVWTSFALRVGAFALFSIPFWVVGIGIAYAGLSIVFGKVYLVISDRTFSIDWDILGVKRHVQGKTQDLRQLELKSSYEVNNQPVMELRLNQGIYVHKFGSGLSRPEKEWLLQEINNFLEAWRSCH